MEYLTIIATRSLILFNPARPTSSSREEPSSLIGTPPTPTLSLLTPPAPVPVPIEVFISSDNQIAYFLLQHVLSSQHAPDHDHHHEGSWFDQSVGSLPRHVVADAEVMVWKEIDQCKKFVHRLGQVFAQEGTVTEGELKALAREFGLGLQKESKHVAREETEYHSAYSSHSIDIGAVSIQA